MLSLLVLRMAAVLPAVLASASVLEARDDQCSAGYKLCAPSGASTQSPPRIGDEGFQNLLVDMVESSLPKFEKRQPQGQSTETSTSTSATLLCCVESLDCVLMSNLLIPFCYDKFTTNYHLSDGSYGTIFDATYSSEQGDSANLANGLYTLADGHTGDFYSNVAPPDTATLAMPSQFQGAGTGAAIPAGSLGFQILTTLTSTIPASTLVATTLAATTLPESVSTSIVILASTVTTSVASSVQVQTVLVTDTLSDSQLVASSLLVTSTIISSVVVNTIPFSSSTSLSTIPESTIAASTRQATTISARVTTIVTTAPSSASAASSTSAPPASTSTSSSAAARVRSVDVLVLLFVAALSFLVVVAS